MERQALTPCHLSVVIPVYRAAGCLHELYTRLRASLETISKEFEILLVEDCGGDDSWEIIVGLAAEDRRVRGIQFSRNFGQHYAISAGIDRCRGKWVIVMDCDLQDRPEEIPRLYAKAQEGFDVVLARRGKRQDGVLKRLGSHLFYKTFNYLADMTYDAEVGNFRIISRKVVENYRRFGEQLRFFGAMVDWMGFRTATIDVEHSERFEGESTYTFRKLMRLATDAIIAYSDKPLRISIKIGFLLAFLSFIFGIYILLNALFYGSAVLGWSSIMVTISFLGGVVIMNLGIIGIYLGKTFSETKKRPLYIIDRDTFSDHPERNHTHSLGS